MNWILSVFFLLATTNSFAMNFNTIDCKSSNFLAIHKIEDDAYQIVSANVKNKRHKNLFDSGVVTGYSLLGNKKIKISVKDQLYIQAVDDRLKKNPVNSVIEKIEWFVADDNNESGYLLRAERNLMNKPSTAREFIDLHEAGIKNSDLIGKKLFLTLTLTNGKVRMHKIHLKR